MTKDEMTRMIKKAKKSGMSMLELARMKQIAYNETVKMEAECIEKGFVFASYIFLNVLITDYWEKTAKQKLPKLMETVFDLYKTVLGDEPDIVTYKQMRDYVFENTGYKMEFEWLDKLDKEQDTMIM